jgi:DNA-binding IclR family transcriptional regulator
VNINKSRVNGQAVLAKLLDSEIEIVLDATRHQRRNYHHLSNDALLQEIAACRKRGYALNENVAVDGISAMAKVICLPGGIPIAAVAIATLSSRMHPTRRSKLARHLEACASAIEAEMKQ